MSVRNYSGSAVSTTLGANIVAGDTTITVAAATNWPSSNFVITIDTGGTEEKVLVGTRTGTTLSGCTRGFDGTTAASHSSGVSVKHTISAVDLSEANAHVNASSAVHGITGSVVGTSDPQTLTNKSLTSPTVTGTATLTGATVAGGTFTGTTLTAPTVGDFTNAVHTHASTAQGGPVTVTAAAVRVWQSGTGQSIPNNAVTAVTFDSEDYDTDAFHSTVSNTTRLVVPAGKAGTYRIFANLAFAGNSTGSRAASIRVNGTTFIAADQRDMSGTSVPVINLATEYHLGVGDYIELMAYQNSGGALNTSNSANYLPHLGMSLVGA